ncbi:MAG: hypothetical protein JWP00_1720 [Chloroflexi bacterium]|jgi:hypothetical protein|nr:hypothetical protein [Chloroflexota bacterium]
MSTMEAGKPGLTVHLQTVQLVMEIVHCPRPDLTLLRVRSH